MRAVSYHSRLKKYCVLYCQEESKPNQVVGFACRPLVGDKRSRSFVLQEERDLVGGDGNSALYLELVFEGTLTHLLDSIQNLPFSIHCDC